MPTSVLQRVAVGARTSFIFLCLLSSCMPASGQNHAISTDRPVLQQSVQARTDVRPLITLDPPAGWDLQVHSFDSQGNRLRELPANYQHLGEAKIGEPSTLHTITLRFHKADALMHIKSTRDFPLERGGTCVEGNVYAADTTCTVLVRFTPQGAGHRLGFVTITHSAAATPAMVGLTGNGFAPVVSFTPAQITTVPGTSSAGAGIIKSATSLAVDGGDVLYITDTGNDLIREIDSSGSITNVTPVFATPASSAVDSLGIIYSADVSGSTYYFQYLMPWGSQTAYGTTYAPGACTPSAPCSLTSVGMSELANMSIDRDDNLFFEEATKGAAEMPVSQLSGGNGNLNLWYLSDQFAYASSTPSSFAVDGNDNIYTSYNFPASSICYLLEEPLYNADYSPTATRVAGGSKCGFSGDGGQAAGAEISASTGQIAFDSAGDLYFADAGNQRVRRIDAVTGIIHTIAGNGTAGYTGDGGRATTATLNSPTGVAVNSQGDVYMISSASSGQVVRKVGPIGMAVFGNQVKATASAAQLVTVTNTGNTAMVLTNTTITGANAADFKIDNNTTTCILTQGSELSAGQTCRIGIIFTPAATGARSATLTLLDNTVSGADIVSLSGTGVLPTPTFTITAPANGASVKSGTAVTFSVSVKSASGTQPTGTIQFKVDGTNHGTPVTLSSGVASTSLTGLSTASHTLSATYSGDTNYAAAGPVSVTITITAAAVVKFTTPTAAQVIASGTKVNAAVTVTSAKTPAPTGKVNFSVDGKQVASGTIASGKTSVSISGVAAGKHTLLASYAGDKGHAAATATETFTISK